MKIHERFPPSAVVTETVELAIDKLGQIVKRDSKERKLFLIYFDGEPVRLPNGRSSWGRIGDVKNAIDNALGYHFFSEFTKEHKYGSDRDYARRLFWDELFESGRVEIREVTRGGRKNEG